MAALPPAAGGGPLVCGGLLVLVPPSPLAWSLVIPPLSRDWAMATTDSSARIASRIRIRPPQEPLRFGSSCRRRPLPFDGGGAWRRTGRVSAAVFCAVSSAGGGGR